MTRFPALRTYLRSEQLERRQAAAVLRLAYVAAFGAQAAFALAVGIAVRLATRLPAPSNSLMAWILVALALMELPFGALVATLATRQPGRSSALSGALMLGVVLATPAWFAALAFATGHQGLPVMLLWMCLALAYGLGFLFASRLAGSAVQGDPVGRDAEREEPADPADPGLEP